MYRSQGGAAQVRVIRRPYTPRDRLLDGRFNAILKLRADIPKNSYLFVWKGEPKEAKLSPLLNEVRGMLERGQIVQRYNDIVRRVEGYVKSRTPTRSREPPTRKGSPYIPASSIKGAARSRLEYKFSKKTEDRPTSYACYVVQEGEVGERHRRFWGDEATLRREGPCSIEDSEGGNVCVVCDIFGAPSLAARLDFSDATLTSGGLEELRDMGITAFRPGSSFSLVCHGRNFNDAELGLFYLSLELFSGSPVIMGFRKYVHNPTTGYPYQGKYYFGLIRFTLDEVMTLTHDLGEKSVSSGQSLKQARAALDQSEYHAYLDYDRGVIKL
ncbi:MAG: RAMP superfamily CRISPR-associated protein [Nitrososphaerota archaeon]